MISKEITLRVRYAETDRMGYVYYGNYATYFEVARVELMRYMGVNYKDMEDGNILLPVSDFRVKYMHPAFYDQELTIRVWVDELPKIRFKFHYQTRNAEGKLLNTAFTELIFVNKENGRPMRAPAHFLERVKSHFSD